MLQIFRLSPPLRVLFQFLRTAWQADEGTLAETLALEPASQGTLAEKPRKGKVHPLRGRRAHWRVVTTSRGSTPARAARVWRGVQPPERAFSHTAAQLLHSPPPASVYRVTRGYGFISIYDRSRPYRILAKRILSFTARASTLCTFLTP